MGEEPTFIILPTLKKEIIFLIFEDVRFHPFLELNRDLTERD